MTEAKTEVIRMRISPELKKAVAKAAKKDGRTISNYLEWIIRKVIEEGNTVG